MEERFEKTSESLAELLSLLDAGAATGLDSPSRRLWWHEPRYPSMSIGETTESFTAGSHCDPPQDLGDVEGISV